ncbi:MAG: glucose-6-phosphate isomerase [Planctomycetes bacterium]|nr:glucose-6-phosphate isomerase [Planctomycetota bacterium]
MLIDYDPTGVFLERGGIRRDALAALGPRLAAARDEVLADARLWERGGPVPVEKEPLDTRFFELPERLLAEFASNGPASELARLRASADRLAQAVDSVVVLGIGGSYMGARTMLEACCHQYYNEVAAAMRRGRPRMYFEGNNVDNDALLDLVRLLESRGDRWGIVVISKSGGTLETAAAFRVLLRELRGTLGREAKSIGELVVPVTGTSGKLSELAKALGCRETFPVPDGVGGRFSVLSAVGLLPGALLGLDIERLLKGAAEVNEHFRTAAPDRNVVLQFVGVCHLMEEQGCDVRILSTWGKRLESFGLWYDQLLAESLGKQDRGALPLTIVNTRDLHSRGQQHQEGKRDKLITNLVIERTQGDPLAIGRSDMDQDKLNELAEKTLPDVMAAAIAGTNKAYLDDGRPTATLRVPRLDEFTLGQLFQMMMLATVVEGRLIGINPYGQPGVEAYKKNMNAILRGKAID